MNNRLPGKSASVTSVPVQGAGPSGLYEESHSKLLRRQFESAEVGFRQFLKKYPKHKLAGNAQYWLGETYYARQRWTSAAKACAKRTIWQAPPRRFVGLPGGNID